MCKFTHTDHTHKHNLLEKKPWKGAKEEQEGGSEGLANEWERRQSKKLLQAEEGLGF